MAWRRPGDKPFSEPMMVKFTDACMRRSASMGHIMKSIAPKHAYIFHVYWRKISFGRWAGNVVYII